MTASESLNELNTIIRLPELAKLIDEVIWDYLGYILRDDNFIGGGENEAYKRIFILAELRNALHSIDLHDDERTVL